MLVEAAFGVLGAAFLVYVAWPLKAGGVVETGIDQAWLFLGVAALVCGGVGGGVAGLLVRLPAPSAVRVVLAGAAAFVAALPALWVSVLLIGRWYPDDTGPLPSRYLFAPMVGWLLFVGVLVVVTRLAAGRVSGQRVS